MSNGLYNGLNDGLVNGLNNGLIPGLADGLKYEKVVFIPEAQQFFQNVLSYGYSIPFFEKVLINNLIIYLKGSKSLNGVSSNWDEIERLTLGAINKGAALVNLRKNYYHGQIVNDYSASFSDGNGFTGNGSSFYIKTNYNPGDGQGSYKWTQNSAVCFFLNLSTALTTGYSLGATNSASTNGTIVTAGQTNYIPFMDINVNSFGSSASGTVNTAYQRCWIGMSRTGASAGKRYVDGSPIANDTHTSAAVVNAFFTEFARNKGGTIQDFSNNSKGVTVYGSKDIDQFAVQKIIEQHFLKPRNKNDWMPNRLLALGDSMTAQGANGNFGRRTRTTLESLGNRWQGHIDGLAGGTIAQVSAIAATNTDPFQKTYLSRDIIDFCAGTNDLSNSSAVTGTDIYNRYKTFVTDRKAAGYKKFILNGMIDRDASFAGGQTQAGFDTGRALFNSLMLADFNVSTSVTNVWTSNVAAWEGCCFIDLYADSKFQNASDTTYFMVDGIHPNNTLDDYWANTFTVPTINANII